MKTKLYVITAIVLLVVLIPLLAHSKSQLDARKELGQMNIQYSPEVFVESAANGDVLAVTLFLEAGMNVNEKHGDSGMTALIAAASKGRTEVVRTLLENGAAINAKDKAGKTALTTAVEGKHLEIVKVLREAGAEAEVEAKYRYESPALSFAAMFPYSNLCRAVLVRLSSVRSDMSRRSGLLEKISSRSRF